LDEPRNEENEGEDQKTKGGVGNYFAGNVSIEQAHVSALHILTFGAAD
jgi:hypothetical protein